MEACGVMVRDRQGEREREIDDRQVTAVVL